MNRRNFIKYSSVALGTSFFCPTNDLFSNCINDPGFTRASFGKDFKWGLATAAYQIEGAWNEDGKGPSVWDHMTHNKPGKIKNKENGDMACDFYHRYYDDIKLIKEMNFQVFRFSLAWARIFPDGTGKPNQKGIDFYHKVIDRCIELGIEPWITIYHWDLPQALEDKGGWANREIIGWFKGFAEFVTKEYGSKVKNWMVLNEPMCFTAVGYFAGVHAPGYVAPQKFLRAAHHATMVQAEGGRIIRRNVPDAYIGTTLSCSPVKPKGGKKAHEKAAYRADILLNRLYIEPLLGMGYPTEDFKFIKGINRYIQPGDMDLVEFDFDFIGLQNYTQTVVRKYILPYVWLLEQKAKNRGISDEKITEMGWEVYPEGIYEIIKQFAAYKNLPPIIITENGAAFKDKVEGNNVHDKQRIEFLQTYLKNVLKAKNEGVDIRGYFVWTFLDNFEWAEGYHPRFGLVHVDYETQKRTIKDSGLWFKNFLEE
ncbi:MAG: GH1 family beta-glucosidase [Saprospiraceae bacterium]|nr:GH1 family beta-glucosidase [Saprospiraceae bacterium]